MSIKWHPSVAKMPFAIAIDIAEALKPSIAVWCLRHIDKLQSEQYMIEAHGRGRRLTLRLVKRGKAPAPVKGRRHKAPATAGATAGATTGTGVGVDPPRRFHRP